MHRSRKVHGARFRIIIVDELDEDLEHCAKSEIAQELQCRLQMLGWDVSLRDGRHHSFSTSVKSRGSITIDVLGR